MNNSHSWLVYGTPGVGVSGVFGGMLYLVQVVFLDAWCVVAACGVWCGAFVCVHVSVCLCV